MGEVPQYVTPDDIPGSSSYSFVAPFAADIDTTSRGSVKYTQFTTSDYTQMSRVSSFIRFQTGSSFYGTTMMVAEWNGVPKYQGSIVSSKDLQMEKTFGYCTYTCSLLEWRYSSLSTIPALETVYNRTENLP